MLPSTDWGSFQVGFLWLFLLVFFFLLFLIPFYLFFLFIVLFSFFWPNINCFRLLFLLYAGLNFLALFAIIFLLLLFYFFFAFFFSWFGPNNTRSFVFLLFSSWTEPTELELPSRLEIKSNSLSGGIFPPRNMHRGERKQIQKMGFSKELRFLETRCIERFQVQALVPWTLGKVLLQISGFLVWVALIKFGWAQLKPVLWSGSFRWSRSSVKSFVLVRCSFDLVFYWPLEKR